VMRMLEKDTAQRFPTMEAATSAMGSVSLSPDDPVRTQMMTLAAAGDNLKLLERFSTPVSQPSAVRSAGGTASRRSSIAVLTITPARVTVSVGDAVQLRATPKTRAGQTLPGRPVSWASTNPDVALVSETGLVTAMAPGTVTITASSADTSSTASITVTAARGRGRTIGLIAAVVGALAVAAGLYVFQPWRSGAGVRSGTGDTTSSPPAAISDTPLVAKPPLSPPQVAETTTPQPAPMPGRDRSHDRGTRPPPDTSDATVATALIRARTARDRAVAAGAGLTELSPGDAELQQGQVLRAGGRRTDAFAHLRNAGMLFTIAESTASAARIAAQRRAPVDTPKPPPVGPAQPVVDQKPMIRDVIAAYARALESRDVKALRRVWPAIGRQEVDGWQDFFGSARNIRAALEPTLIEVAGDQADVVVAGTLTFQNVNPPRQDTQAHNFHAHLVRQGTVWTIASVQRD